MKTLFKGTIGWLVALALLGILSGFYISNERAKSELKDTLSETCYYYDMAQIDGAYFGSEFESNVICKALNDRYNNMGTYFTCSKFISKNGDNVWYTIEREFNKEEVMYFNSGVLSEKCSEKIEEMANEIENSTIDKPIFEFVKANADMER